MTEPLQDQMENYTIFATNRSEQNLIVQLFGRFLFNELIFEKQEALCLLMNIIYGKTIIEPNSKTEITYFLKPKDVYRNPSKATPDTRITSTVTNFTFGHGHFDIAAIIKTKTNHNSSLLKLILFEIKWLSDIQVNQLLYEVEMCRSLLENEIPLNGQLIKLDEVYLVNICSHANLQHTRAFQVNYNGQITIPKIGILPEHVKVITFDTIISTIIKTRELSSFHEQAADKILLYMLQCVDAKTLKIDGTPKGGARPLVHTTRSLIEKVMAM